MGRVNETVAHENNGYSPVYIFNVVRPAFGKEKIEKENGEKFGGYRKLLYLCTAFGSKDRRNVV